MLAWVAVASAVSAGAGALASAAAAVSVEGKNADIIRCGLNKPYELAKARGDMIGMIGIPGAEITSSIHQTAGSRR